MLPCFLYLQDCGCYLFFFLNLPKQFVCRIYCFFLLKCLRKYFHLVIIEQYDWVNLLQLGFFFSSIICLTIMCGQPQIYCSEVLPHLCLCMFKALYRRTDGRAYIQRDTIRNICRQTESERDRQRPGHRETHRRGLENQRKKKGMIQIQ